MGTWSALPLKADTLKGLAPRFVLDADAEDLLDATLTGGTIEADMVDQAKRMVKRLVTKKWGGLVVAEGGQAAFFDAVADVADAGEALYDSVQELLGYGFLHHAARDARLVARGRLADDAEYYFSMLTDAVGAFGAIADAALRTDSEDDITVMPQRSYAVTTTVTYS